MRRRWSRVSRPQSKVTRTVCLRRLFCIPRRSPTFRYHSGANNYWNDAHHNKINCMQAPHSDIHVVSDLIRSHSGVEASSLSVFIRRQQETQCAFVSSGEWSLVGIQGDLFYVAFGSARSSHLLQVRGCWLNVAWVASLGVACGSHPTRHSNKMAYLRRPSLSLLSSGHDRYINELCC